VAPTSAQAPASPGGRPAFLRVQTRRRVRLLGAAVAVGAGLGGIALVRAHVAEPVRIASSSMNPTLRAGDVVLVDRRHVDVEDLDHGDLVTFRNPQGGEETLKRVVGLPGESVAIIDAVLHVDDRPVDEPYVDFSEWDGMFTARVVVPPDSVFVLGDNRVSSVDSRDFGAVPERSLDGRVRLRLWPPVRLGGPTPQPHQDG
jgi:signal peptidase I